MPALNWLMKTSTARRWSFTALSLQNELLLEQAHGDKIILDLLESGEHRLPVIGDALPIDRARGVDLRAAQPAFEQDLRAGGAERPHHVGDAEGRGLAAGPLQHGGQADVGEIARDRNADQRVLLLHGAFGRGDIGTPLEQDGRHRDRNPRNTAAEQMRPDRQFRGRPADQHGDGVFELRALQ